MPADMFTRLCARVILLSAMFAPTLRLYTPCPCAARRTHTRMNRYALRSGTVIDLLYGAMRRAI